MFGKISLWPPVVFLLLAGAAAFYVLSKLHGWVGGGTVGWLTIAVCVLCSLLWAIIADGKR